MQAWLEDMLGIVHDFGSGEQVFHRIEAAARQLGFEYCAYGLRTSFTGVDTKISTLNNYPSNWRVRYKSLGYLDTDPTVLHGQRSQAPLIWGDEVFASARHFWEDARSFGLRFGWAQSSLDAPGVGGMLTLCRSGEAISASELHDRSPRMQLLACIAHQALSRAFGRQTSEGLICLTARETEVLKWTA